jgi:hypothetical protein
MTIGKIAGICFLATLCTVSLSVFADSQPAPSRRMVEPCKQALGAASQQVKFTIATPGRGLVGTRVFLNPGSVELTVESDAYVGSVYFSHDVTGPTSTFVLPLKRVVSGKSELVLLPILAANSDGRGATLKIVAASIRKPDNTEFR